MLAGSRAPARPGPSVPRFVGALRHRLLVLTCVLVAHCASGATPALAGVANAGIAGALRSNPLAGLPWGHYTGPIDGVFPAYQQASGVDRQLLGKIALRPLAYWFGDWIPDASAQSTISQYIANVTGGNPDVLAQVSVFRLVPWEHQACSQLPTVAQQDSYRRWIDAWASGIGSSRLALILQPDLPFALCAPHHSRLPLDLVAYAARVFSALPHTTVYIDAGAADWPTVTQAASLLLNAGVRYARGFALDATHFDSTSRQIAFGAAVATALGRAGVHGRHFVIDTAQNGRPFTYQQYHRPNFDNAAVCRSRAASRCVTLGIPPTWHVADPAWGLSRAIAATAAKLVDAYLWFGRPWLDDQAAPFDLGRALALARSTPF